MKVGFHSPLPPAPTGVADYAAALFSELRRFGTVEAGAERADIHLYHLGNNGLHAAIYRRALERPGVVALHDGVLHHLLMGILEREAYVEEFVYNYGEWGRDTAVDLWEGRAGSAGDAVYFRFPMLRRIAERSLAVVVHNPAAARMVREHAPAARVFQVPHLWREAPPVAEAERFRLRQRLGIAANAFVFGVYGYLRETKRIPAVLRAFQRAKRRELQAALLVAGRFVSPQLERALEPELKSAGAIRVDWVPSGAFHRLIAIADAAINLRYPAAGETSGIAIQLMGMAKPVIMTDCEETSSFPADTCLKVLPGLAEEDELAHYMVLLVADRRLAAETGGRAQAHIRTRHGLTEAAEAYWRILCECCGAHS